MTPVPTPRGPRRAPTEPLDRPVNRSSEPLDRPVVRPGPPADVPDPAPVALGVDLLPPPGSRRRIRPAGALTVAGILAAGSLTALLVDAAAAGPGAGPADRPAAAEPAALAQYDYALRVPAGWRHSGGRPERRRTLLTPAAAPAGSDLIAVEQTPLGYDGDAEPDRARAELAEEFAAAARTDPGLLGPLRPDRVGGRPVTTYRQVSGSTTTDWHVLFDRDAQLSVGCRHTASGAAAVATACAEVLASLVHRHP